MQQMISLSAISQCHSLLVWDVQKSLDRKYANCMYWVRTKYLIPSPKIQVLVQYLQQYTSRCKSFPGGPSLGKWQEKKVPWMTFPPVQPHLAQFLRKTWCTHKVMVASCYLNVQQPDSKGYTITLFKCYPGNNLSLGRRCILIQETKFKSLGITSWSCLPFRLNSFNKTLALTLGCTKSKYDLCFLLIISSEGTL